MPPLKREKSAPPPDCAVSPQSAGYPGDENTHGNLSSRGYRNNSIPQVIHHRTVITVVTNLFVARRNADASGEASHELSNSEFLRMARRTRVFLSNNPWRPSSSIFRQTDPSHSFDASPSGAATTNCSSRKSSQHRSTRTQGLTPHCAVKA